MMPGKTMIGGTAYDVKPGSVMVGGTVYTIKEGKTMVGGTAYSIKVAKGTPLSEYSVGSIVKLNYGGKAREFIVVHQGKPSSIYDDSCDGTWLLMKDIYTFNKWHTSDSNSYKASTIHSYLNSTFLGLFDSDIQAAIKEVKIPYVNGTATSAVASGANGLAAKIFLLSGYEVGWTQSTNKYFPIDGACLSYFSGTAATDSKRIGYRAGEAFYWWLRSPCTGSTYYAWGVNASGSYGNSNCSNAGGVRPALVLDSSLLVSDDLIIA